MNTKWKAVGNVAAVALLLRLAGGTLACEGPVGPPGENGLQGPPGDAGMAPEAAEATAPPPTPDAASPRQFVTTGPGVKLSVTSTVIDKTGTVTVSFTVTDGAGVPLDYAGVYTNGPVVAKFVLSWLAPSADGGAPGEYTAYTQQKHASVDGTKTVPMPDSDTGGAVAEVGAGQGTYTYTFGTTLPAGFDATATHTVGVWATRQSGGLTYVVNTLYDFVPAGGTVSTTRDIVTTQACNQCHNPLAYHEGNTARREVRLCALCHASPTVDVSNGSSLDLPAMVHKIHRGRYLPSVVAGGVYQLTEDESQGQDAAAPDASNPDAAPAITAPAFVDHSTAWYPGAVQNCRMCHQGSQGAVWSTAPSRAACGACHDLTSFVYPPPVGMTLHPGGQQTSDTTCLMSGCHGPTDRFSIAAVHLVPSTDPSAPVLALTIRSVANTQPAQTPVLHFSVTRNGQPLDILTSPLPYLAVTIAGPTTDYASSSSYSVETGAAPPSGLVLDGAVGSYAFTFPAPVAASATGSYAVGMEGYLTPAGAGGPIYAALNPVSYVAVTDPTPVPRRTVVDRDKCNSCHSDLLAHGGTRKSPEYCVLCHNPNAVDDVGVARYEVSSTQAPGDNFKLMVHKLHRGNQLAQGYVLGSDPLPTPANPDGTPVDFGAVGYPGDLRACWACHAATSYLPPLPPAQLPTVTQETLTCMDPSLNPATYCSTRGVGSQASLGPIGAACTGCHDQSWNVSHVEVNTVADGTEACVTCHGPAAPWDVQTVHVLPP